MRKSVSENNPDTTLALPETIKVIAEQLLGWKAERALEDMCRDAWRFEKNHGFPVTL